MSVTHRSMFVQHAGHQGAGCSGVKYDKVDVQSDLFVTVAELGRCSDALDGGTGNSV